MVAALICVASMSNLQFAVLQWRSTPSLQIEDAYKWLFHATLGGEHAVTDEDGVRAWMDREWAGLANPLPGEALVTKLTSDGKLLRVNLRPYKAAGGDKEMLLQIFISSAHAFSARREVFAGEWRGLGSLLRDHPFGNLTWPAWEKLDKETRPSYPAIEHSAGYLKAAKPAYRVVLGSLWAG